MAISHGGSVELAFPFLDPNLNSVFGVTTNVLPDFSSEVETRRAPWLAPFSSSVGSMHKIYPELDSQLHSVKRDSTTCLLPMFAASDSSYTPINDCHINPLFMPFGNQGNRLRASPVPQSYVETLLFRNREGKPSFPHALISGGPPLFISGKHGDIMAKMTPQEIMNAKALAASKSHSEAERRRRERINTHLATLRSLLPNTTKTDKASLLAEVINHVKDLKRKAAEIAEWAPIPSDTDELRVDTISSDGAEDGVLIKVSLCCDDHPTLLSDLTKTLRNLKLQTVKAEIASLGGRMKNVILLTSQDTTSGKPDESLLENVHEALREMLERSGSNQSSPAVFGSGSISKRQKLGF